MAKLRRRGASRGPLYEGYDAVAHLFRYAMLAFDIATIALFLVTAAVEHAP